MEQTFQWPAVNPLTLTFCGPVSKTKNHHIKKYISGYQGISLITGEIKTIHCPNSYLNTTTNRTTITLAPLAVLIST